MSLKNEDTDASENLAKQKTIMEILHKDLTHLQESFIKAISLTNEIVQTTNNLANKLQPRCSETIELMKLLLRLQDGIKEKLQDEGSVWENLENDLKESNACFLKYLECYKDIVLNLADQTSSELDPEGSFISASTKSSLASSSSHFQQMFVANDPLADRELFRALDAKDQTLTTDIKTMQELLVKCHDMRRAFQVENEKYLRNMETEKKNLESEDSEEKNKNTLQ